MSARQTSDNHKLPTPSVPKVLKSYMSVDATRTPKTTKSIPKIA